MTARAHWPKSLETLATRDFARQVAMAVLADAAPVIVRAGPNSFRLPFLLCWPPIRMVDRKLSDMLGLDRLQRGTSSR